MGDIGLMGGPAKLDGKAVEGVRIFLGGTIGENPTVGLCASRPTLLLPSFLSVNFEHASDGAWWWTGSELGGVCGRRTPLQASWPAMARREQQQGVRKSVQCSTVQCRLATAGRPAASAATHLLLQLASEFEKGIPCEESILLPKLKDLLIEHYGAKPK